MSREFEKSYRIRASDEVLKKMNLILQAIDQRLDDVEQVKAAFLAGNRLDVDALLKKVTDDIALKSSAMQELIDETEGGFTPGRIHETADKRFTSDVEQQAHVDALELANTRIDSKANASSLGAHTARTDNPHAVTAAQVGTLTELEILEDLDVLLAEVLGTASPSMDTLGKVELALGVIDAALATVSIALGKRLRVDAAQVFTAAEIGRALANVGASVLAGHRNKLLNGGLGFFQRGVSIAIAAGASAYVADRFLITNGTNRSVTVDQAGLALSEALIPQEQRYKMTFTFATAPTTGTLRVAQRIESVRTLAGKAASARGYVSGPTGAETLACEIVQNFGTGGAPSGAVTTAAASLDVATIYNAAKKERKAQFVVPGVSAKLLGTGLNDYLELAWVMTPRQAGVYEFARASFVEGDASFEADPFAGRHREEERRMLQRYCEIIDTTPFGAGFVDTATVARATLLYSLKRAVPTISLTGSVIVGIANAADITTSSVTYGAITPYGTQAVVASTGMTIGHGTIGFLSTGSYFIIDAEL